MKDKAVGKEFITLKPKMYSYFADDNNNHKKDKLRKQKYCFDNKS